MTGLRAGFVSLTSAPASGDEAAYLRWHLLDHLPEQYTIPGIRLGTRWFADEACVERRLVATDELAPSRHLVTYLLTEPVADTLGAFARLGRALREADRYPEPATPHLLGAYELRHVRAAPSAVVSDGAIPFRPHRGVYLLVERAAAPVADADLDALLAIDGVAGVLVLGPSDDLGTGPDQGARFGVPAWDPGGSHVTIVYLDADVETVAAAIEPWLRARWDEGSAGPRFAGPFRSPTHHDAWPEGPAARFS
jgi:hypothetical protein